MNKSRIEYFDAIKAFAMFLVICGHTLQYLDRLQTGKCLHDFIYSFHMPLFMMISGYFASSSLKKNFSVFMSKKIEQLILPVIIWTIPLLVLIFLTGRGNIINELIGSYWFLRTLFACYVFTWGIKKIFKNDVLGFTVSTVLLVFLPKGSFLQFNWLYIFFWIGIFFKKNNLEKMNKTKSLILIFFSLAIFIVTYFIQHQSFVNINPITIKTNSIDIILNFFIALSACLFIFFTFRMNKKWHTITKDIGKYTLGIYLVQGIIVESILPLFLRFTIQTTLFTILVTLLTSLFLLFLCYLFVKYSSKNQLVNLLLFGNQYK